jgi:hypothetical protein
VSDSDQLIGQNLVDGRNEERRNALRGDRLFTVPPKLTERQNYVYELTADRRLNALTAGIELHRRQRCPYCQPDQPCQYAEANGREVLEALKRKGLVKMDRHHVYRRTDEPTTTQTDDIPY